MERTQDIQRHRMKMMAEMEQRERDEQQANRDMLNQKRAHDLKVSPVLLSACAHYCPHTPLVPPGTAGESQTGLLGGQRAAAVSASPVG